MKEAAYGHLQRLYDTIIRIESGDMCDYGVVLFYTTSAVMRAEKILEKGNLAVKLIPTPRELSSDCGIALRFNWDQMKQVKTLLDEAQVESAGIHQIRM